MGDPGCPFNSVGDRLGYCVRECRELLAVSPRPGWWWTEGPGLGDPGPERVVDVVDGVAQGTLHVGSDVHGDLLISSAAGRRFNARLYDGRGVLVAEGVLIQEGEEPGGEIPAGLVPTARLSVPPSAAGQDLLLELIDINVLPGQHGASTARVAVTAANPTNTPTPTPIHTPTNTPRHIPTKTTTATATHAPTAPPTNTATATARHTSTPSPTNTPTRTPINTPTRTPTRTPTNTSTRTPTNTPTRTPTNTSTRTPTDTPTRTPIRTPTAPVTATANPCKGKADGAICDAGRDGVVRTCEGGICGTCVPAGVCSLMPTRHCAFDEACSSGEGRCVIHTVPSPRYVDNGDGTVTDRKTCLVWEKKTGVVGDNTTACKSTVVCPDPHEVDYLYQWCLDAGSDSRCDTLGNPPDGSAFTLFLSQLNDVAGGGRHCFARHCDWRLPKSGGRPDLGSSYASGEPAELESILLSPYPCTTSPCIDPIFGPTAPRTYWSATTYAPGPTSAWSVLFSRGFVSGYNKTLYGSVRGVRGGS
jgi:hypothetical protein